MSYAITVYVPLILSAGDTVTDQLPLTTEIELVLQTLSPLGPAIAKLKFVVLLALPEIIVEKLETIATGYIGFIVAEEAETVESTILKYESLASI